MKAEKVIEIHDLLNHFNIEIIIDGGWAVDALLEEQTRPHDDLDIAVSHHHVQQLRSVLFEHGFTDLPRPDTTDYNFVLTDNEGNKIDVHSCLFDEAGNNIYGIAYPTMDCFSGIGTINGCTVKCITPHWLVKFHTGYEVDEMDYHDVKHLCKKFDIELPQDYQEFLD